MKKNCQTEFGTQNEKCTGLMLAKFGHCNRFLSDDINRSMHFFYFYRFITELSPNSKFFELYLLNKMPSPTQVPTMTLKFFK